MSWICRTKSIEEKMNLLERNGYRLRAPEPEDLGCMFDFENTSSMWEVSTPTGPYSRFYLKQYLEETKNDIYVDRQLRLMLETPEKRVAGIVDLFNFDPFHSRAEVGIVIAEEFRRQGIGRLAMEMLMEFSFGYLGLRQLYAFIDEQNHPCLKLFQRCGFETAGHLKDWMKYGSDFREVVLVQRINSK